MAEMNIQRNARVLAADGEVGPVRHVVVDPQTKEVTHLVVDVDDRDQLIPISSVASVEGDRVTLKGSRADLNASGFDREHYHAIDEEVVREETTQQAERGGAPLVDAAQNEVEIAGSERRAAPAQRSADAPQRTAATRQTGAEQPYRLQLREERLHVQKQQEQAGEVTIGKRVTEHTETVNVPLREERVIIERTAGSGQPVEGGARLSEGETIEVPVMRETATANKEAVVTEEVNVRKEVTEREQAVSGTVRKEELVVDGDQNVVSDGSRGAAKSGERMSERRG